MQNKNKMYVSVIIGIMVALLTYQGTRVIGYFGFGLDSSWMYALNYFVDKKIIFGRDIIFTYGPLGFLYEARNISNHLEIALLFWGIMALLIALLLTKMIYLNIGNKTGNIKVVIGVVLFCFSFLSYRYESVEEYLLFIFLSSFVLSFRDKKERIYIFIADAIFILSFFMKFSLMIQMMSSLILVCIYLLVINRKEAVYLLFHIVGCMIGMVFGYLSFYSFSIKNLYTYVKGSLEISGGYNSAMSFMIGDKYIIYVLVLIAIYIFFIIYSKKNQFNLLLLFALSGPLFFLYKHGFVRADDLHLSIFFGGAYAFLGIIVFLYDFSKESNEHNEKHMIRSQKFISCVTLIVCVGLLWINYNVGIGELLEGVCFNTVGYLERYNSIKNEQQYLSEDLPIEFLEKIGDNTVTIYPNNILFNRNNNLNYKPLFCVQGYVALTPWIDEKMADEFTKEEAPQYIIMSSETIDYRWPFLEAPQTWWAIKNNYELVMMTESLYLLKKIDMDESYQLELINSEKIECTGKIYINNSDYIKIKSKNSIDGKIMNFLYKTAPVNMTVYYKNGEIVTGRVLLDLLSGGADFSSIVFSTDQFVDYMCANGELAEVECIQFSGTGLINYNQTFEVEKYKKVEVK